MGPGSEIFRPKTTRDQDGDNKKKFSQIGPVVLELLSHTQTDKIPYYFVVLIVSIYISDIQISRSSLKNTIQKLQNHTTFKNVENSTVS